MDLSEEQWRVIGTILPKDEVRADGRGRPWSDRRQVLNGVLWILRTGAPWKDLPERYGAYQTVRPLMQHGHQHIAIIKGTEKNLDALERLRGYRQAMHEGGLHVECHEINGDFSEASGYDAIKRILTLKPRPTAIFASNDSMALGALSALRETGIAVPREMALAGFDDIPVARNLSPA